MHNECTGGVRLFFFLHKAREIIGTPGAPGMSVVWNVAADIGTNKRDPAFGAAEQNYLIVC